MQRLEAERLDDEQVETWVLGRPPLSLPDLLVYIMVDSVAATLDAFLAHGGAVQPIGVDAPEVTARFRAPGGNVIGLYQEPGSAPAAEK